MLITRASYGFLYHYFLLEISLFYLADENNLLMTNNMNSLNFAGRLLEMAQEFS